MQFDKTVLQKLALAWKDALVIKLLGMSLSYPMMKDKFRHSWRLKARYNVMSIGFGYFLVKFDAVEDRDRVMKRVLG